MVSHSNSYYLDKMSSDARKVVLSILSNKPNYTQLKKDVIEYYKLRDVTDKKLTTK